MLLLGLDAAVDLKNFGYAIGRLADGSIELTACGTLDSEARIDEVLAAPLRLAQRALIAIDAPLGWPVPLGDALTVHRAGEALRTQPNDLFRRKTDHAVRRLIGKQPLDVGADRIARAAWSALAVLNHLRASVGDPLPLAWSEKFPGRFGVIEVYPAATLKAWGARSSGYKKREEATAREEIATSFPGDTAWLRQLASDSVDTFDAGLCLIAARDFLTGEVARPDDLELARHEGWIWVKEPKSP